LASITSKAKSCFLYLVAKTVNYLLRSVAYIHACAVPQIDTSTKRFRKDTL